MHCELRVYGTVLHSNILTQETLKIFHTSNAELSVFDFFKFNYGSFPWSFGTFPVDVKYIDICIK